MAHLSDDETIQKTHNTARFFTENRHISWVLLIFTILWGLFSYITMPKRKDPEIPVRIAAAVITWPGASAEDMEERATRLVEDKLAENSKVSKVESTTRSSIAVLTIELDKNTRDTSEEFDDVWLKLQTMSGLPDGATIQFIKDFGDTSALMLTIASPRASDVEVELRSRKIEAAIREVRSLAPGKDAPTSADQKLEHATTLACFPLTLDPTEFRVVANDLAKAIEARGARDVHVIEGPGFLGVDALSAADDQKIIETSESFVGERLRSAEIHPDVWRMTVVRDPATTREKLSEVAGAKYSYRDLDRYTDEMIKALEAVPEVSRASRAGVLSEVIRLDYSQDKLASFGITPGSLENILASRNIVARGGSMDLEGKTVLIAPGGEFKNEAEIGSVIVGRNQGGSPLYLRDLVTITRGYEDPQYLAYSSWKDEEGNWQHTRAISISLNMRSGLQIADFGKAVEAKLAQVRQLLPEDLVVERVSDQPQQVEESVSLFMRSLLEAIVLVVVVALIGFWEWRSALVIALSIPTTLAMTFGLMRLLGIDVQQVSVASLIIALGLLVDDPVVASDAIKRDLSHGIPRLIASWLGPTKLATAIMFATITNIVAYLPFLTLSGDTGKFIYALPVVLTASLVASRIVSMTFIPLLGYVVLRAPKKHDPPMSERRKHGFAKYYTRAIQGAIRHRWIVMAVAVALFAAGVSGVRHIKQSFFPKDLSYLSYVDVWLPEDAPVSRTRQLAAEVDRTVREAAAEFEKTHPNEDGQKGTLDSITTFVGGGGPRFWFSVAPEQRQSNYAQLVMRAHDKHLTSELVPVLQAAVNKKIAGARVDVRQLETGKAVGIPVSIRVSGSDTTTLREIADKVGALLRKDAKADRVRDNWGADNFALRLAVDADRANQSGVSNADVARSSSTALNGNRVGTLIEGDHKVPIVTRLRGTERQELSDLENLYVYNGQNEGRVPLRQVASLEYVGEVAKIARRDHARTITVGAFPVEGALASEVLADVAPGLEELQKTLPPGYKVEVGGEQENQKESFRDLAIVLGISVVAIFLLLVFQFRNAAKPLIVFAAIPFGIVASLLSLLVMGTPFGFMAFLGVISLVGVIVSHVIVLFDFIEEKHEEGEDLMDALIDAGIIRLRPVLVTVLATVLGLFPLAEHGGPLWEPLCYVQIGGLTFATVVTLVLVPVLYSIFVLDLKLVKWKKIEAQAAEQPVPLAAE